ncbi:hypothetical protein ACS0TY_013763 [Phlomoides rotata]
MVFLKAILVSLERSGRGILCPRFSFVWLRKLWIDGLIGRSLLGGSFRFLEPLDIATTGNIRCLQGVLSAYGGLSGLIYNPAKLTVYYGSAVTRLV